jgi:pimeloyl-ACP methyl ester carboxylesterase
MRTPDEITHSQVAVDGGVVQVAETGPADAPTYVLLHGWPESSRTWQDLMRHAAPSGHLVAIDLPGIGGSLSARSSGTKREIAQTVHEVVETLGLVDIALVGHDIGGMVAYAYLRAYPKLRSAVIMDVPVPGVDPWDDFVRQPFLWHFAFHTVPGLPERVVTGREAAYFDYFYDLLSAHADVPSKASRAEQVAAYQSAEALTAGFDWYRAFAADEADNRAFSAAQSVATPLLYLRGEHERGGPIQTYVDGLHRAGVSSVTGDLIRGAGHFPQEEAPAQTWHAIQTFAARVPDPPIAHARHPEGD